MIRTVILCGGQGTRIRDVADNIPKPLISIGERPILWHIMKLYAHYDMKDFVLCLGYKGWHIKEYFLNYRKHVLDFTLNLNGEGDIQYHGEIDEMDWRVTFAETGINNMTGSRIWQIRPYVEDSEIFCVTYGDGVADLDIGALIDYHRSHGQIGTVTGVHPPPRFGEMDIRLQADISYVQQFAEKPQQRGFINGGFFVFDHRLWDYLDDDDDLVFEQEPLQQLARDGQLVVYPHEGFWHPMDTYRDWKQLNTMWEEDRAPWKR